LVQKQRKIARRMRGKSSLRMAEIGAWLRSVFTQVRIKTDD